MTKFGTTKQQWKEQHKKFNIEENDCLESIENNFFGLNAFVDVKCLCWYQRGEWTEGRTVEQSQRLNDF